MDQKAIRLKKKVTAQIELSLRRLWAIHEYSPYPAGTETKGRFRSPSLGPEEMLEKACTEEQEMGFTASQITSAAAAGRAWEIARQRVCRLLLCPGGPFKKRAPSF